MVLFSEYTMADFWKNALIPIIVSLVIILVIVVLAVLMINIISQLTILNSAVAAL